MNKEDELYEIRRSRLAELLAGYPTQEEFARAIDKDKSYVSRMLYSPDKKGCKRIGDKVAVQIQNSLGLPRGWLDGLADVAESDMPKASASVYKVEVLDIKASAGTGVMVRDEFIETIKSIEYTADEARAIFGARHPEHIKMIAVNGDSMSGTFEPRDQIFVDVNHDYFDGDGIYIFTLDEKLYIKRLQLQHNRIAVISDNKKYETWYIDKQAEAGLHIVAKVLVSQSRAYKFHA